MSAKRAFFGIFQKLAVFCCAMFFCFANAFSANLPSGYTELEYIKKTSLAYIDSGISQTDSVGVSIDVKFDSYGTGTAYQYALGAYNNADYIGVWKSSNSTVSLCFVNYIATVSSSDNTNFHNFKINYLNSRKFSYDDSNVGNITQTKSATSPSIYIGDTNYSQHFGNSSFSIKRVRISNETDIVFDGIPAKTTINGTEVVGLYDTVSGTFKTATAGTFIAGPVVLNPCRNLFDKNTVDQNFVSGKIKNDSGTEINDSTSSYSTTFIKVLPSTPYTFSWAGGTSAAIQRIYYYTDDKQWISRTGLVGYSPVSFTTPNNCAYIQIQRSTNYNNSTNFQLELGSTATAYVPYNASCHNPNPIKIATTAYNTAQFNPVVTELNTTIATIRDVVTNTINQTKAIADLQATKQTRPEEQCPAGKKCLLVETEENGVIVPHWFPIIEAPEE